MGTTHNTFTNTNISYEHTLLWPHRERLTDMTPRQHTRIAPPPTPQHPPSATLTSPPPATDSQEPDSEGAEEQQQWIQTPSSTCLSFHQTGDLVLHDTTVYAAIVELFLELEGVDPEPDFWARSSRGPWHIAVNEDCAQSTIPSPIRTPNYNPRPPSRRCDANQGRIHRR